MKRDNTSWQNSTLNSTDNLSDLGPGRERDDDREQGGYRIPATTEQVPPPQSGDTIRDYIKRTNNPLRPITPQERYVAGGDYPGEGSNTRGSLQQLAEAKTPDVKDLMRQSTAGPPPVISAGLPKQVPPPSIASVAPPSPASPPAGIMRQPMKPEEVPTLAPNQRRIDLLKQMGTLGKPTDPNAVDASGKHIYRMSLGQKIAGNVANFANGFATRGRAPVIPMGPGTTNGRYAEAENQREKEYGGVKEELGEQDKLDTSEEKIRQDAVKQAYEGQLGGYREKLGEAAGQNADTRGQLADTKAKLDETTGALNQAKEGRLEDPIGQRIKEADRIGLKGQERKDYLAGWKPERESGRQPTEAEQWTQMFTRDNKRPPTADEFANRKSKTSTLGDKIEADKGKALGDAEKKATERIDKLMKGMSITDPNDADPEFSKAKQGVYADLQKEKAQIQNEYETRAKQNAQTRPAAAPAAARAPSATNNAARVRGKYLGPDDPKQNLKKGQTVTLPQNQVDSAIKAGTFQRL